MVEYDYLYKILIVGPAGGGKSNVLLQYADNTFTENYISTIGVDFRAKTISQDGAQYKLQIWDTGGQERFKAITRSYYQGSMGFLVVFDITSREQFDEIGNFLQEIDNYLSEEYKKNVIIVGNKADLEEKRQVTFEKGMALAEENQVYYMETSAKTGSMIEDAFQKLISVISKKQLLFII